jgi:hypothetical protein
MVGTAIEGGKKGEMRSQVQVQDETRLNKGRVESTRERAQSSTSPVDELRSAVLSPVCCSMLSCPLLSCPVSTQPRRTAAVCVLDTPSCGARLPYEAPCWWVAICRPLFNGPSQRCSSHLPAPHSFTGSWWGGEEAVRSGDLLFYDLRFMNKV